MATTSKHLMDWLRDAYAMEKAAIEILEKQEQRLKNYPQMHAKVSEHLKQSEQQAAMLKGTIKTLGGDTSALKQGVAKFMGNMAALVNAGAEDEVVKDGIANYAVEHFEIASYRALIAAAEAENQPEVARVCSEILQQEEAMAQWLEANLPQVTQSYLARDFAGAPAKR